MSKKKKDQNEEEIIIGYNTIRSKNKGHKKDNPQSKKQQKREHRKRKRRLEKIKKAFILLLKVLLVLAILAGIAAFLFVSPVFNITEVVVENAGKITENAYIALSEIQIRRKYISNKQIKN